MNFDRAYSAYLQRFGIEPTIVARAPGRVNLIGEHTDYNDGFVLPCAIDRETVVLAGASEDSRLTAIASDFGNQCDVSTISATFERVEFEWANYVRGVSAVLCSEGLDLKGARLAIAGNVPLGSGLSSSASLEVAVGNALAALAGMNVAPEQMALLAQRAENVHVGCQCGIMDQLIAARGVAGHALLIDCRSLECRPVPLPAGLSILIAHSGIRHNHVSGEYNVRRLQCEAAARHYSVTALRNLDEQRLIADKAALDETVFRRARHIVTENERTLKAADALQDGDLHTMGQLMAESHESMRDDFEITVRPIDILRDIIGEQIGNQGGARMTGGGFGGCVVALLPQTKVDEVCEAVARHYKAPDGNPCELIVCNAAGGADYSEFVKRDN